jgi:hypothetical protein
VLEVAGGDWPRYAPQAGITGTQRQQILRTLRLQLR